MVGLNFDTRSYDMNTLERVAGQEIVTTNTASIVPVQKNFNQGYFDIKDPLEDAGTDVDPFGTSLIYSVEREKHSKIIGELYDEVLQKVLQGAIPDANVKLIDFNDSMVRNERPRRYIVIDRETQRGTNMSLYTTFLTYGDSIYLRIAAFVSGPLSTSRPSYPTVCLLIGVNCITNGRAFFRHR